MTYVAFSFAGFLCCAIPILVGNVLRQDRVLSEDRTGHCRHVGTCLQNILQTRPPDRVLSEDRTGHLQTYFY